MKTLTLAVFFVHFLLLLVLLPDLVSPKNIIFVPLPISSHAYKHFKLARALVEGKGHEVWLVLHSSVLRKGFVDVTGPGLHVIEYNTSLSGDDDLATGLFYKAFLEERGVDWGKAAKMVAVFTQDFLGNQTLYKQLQKVKADLFVLDSNVAIAKMFTVFPYRLGVPFAYIHFSFQPFYRRVPFSPATTPIFFSMFGEDMTFSERLQNTVGYVMDYLYMPGPMLYEDVVARFAPDKPYLPLHELEARAEVWLVQTDHVFFYPEPTVPNVKQIGGLAASPATEPLQEPFRSFLNEASEGVVVVSFGSLVLDVPEQLINKLMAAFMQIRPVKVIMRANVTSPDPKHVMTSTWIPQNALLADAKSRVLVTHCGLSGQYQGMYHAVPMLGLPMFYDQPYNANIMTRKGFGLMLNFHKATVEDLVHALKELLNNSTYKNNLSKASALFRELYGVPSETAAYWLDHVLQHGGAHMRSSGQRMPLYQFLLLDVLALLTSLVVMATVVVCCCLRLVMRKVMCSIRSEGRKGRATKGKRD